MADSETIKVILHKADGVLYPVAGRKDKAMIVLSGSEGCLFLQGVRKTTRYQDIEVEYYDFAWKKQRQKLSGWTAQIAQHEIDHCNGIGI